MLAFVLTPSLQRLVSESQLCISPLR
uniref:Uncharacterized protein n=1 Tax=Anguilla anguilla TaxID=7936 RepID=A0A0E9RJC0_ANGAN